MKKREGQLKAKGMQISRGEKNIISLINASAMANHHHSGDSRSNLAKGEK